jgi:hypothetical protein
VLRRLDRMLGSVGDRDMQAPVSSSRGTSSRRRKTSRRAALAVSEVEELFSFWIYVDCVGGAKPHAPRLDARLDVRLDTPAGLRVTLLAAGFACAASAAAVSMVMPYRPSVSQITDFFATSVPGYDEEQGIPVLARDQPLYDSGGVRAGSFVIRPTLETGFSFDDNVLGERGSPSSLIFRSSPSVAINSDWSRNAIGAYLSANTAQYPDTPVQSRTDWTGAVGGTATIGRGDLTFAYSHLALHEDSTFLDAVATTTPLAFTVDDWRATYALKTGAFTFTPNIDLSTWRFGTATVGGVPTSEAIQDHDVLQGGLFTAYELSGRTSLLATTSLIDAHYLHSAPGAPAPSAFSTLLMAGIDYRYSGALRLRVLLGGESREFESGTYRSRIAPIGQATVIWTPTGLTTVTGTLARTLEDAIQADTGGYTNTRAEIEVDHELLRNVVLTSHIGVQNSASLQQAGSQTSVYGGVTGTWRINRDLSLIMSYQYTTQSGQSGLVQQPLSATAIGLGPYTRNVVDVRLRAAL